MPDARLHRLEHWFDGYVRSFASDDADLMANIQLKVGHTRRVRAEIVALGRQLGLSGSELALAEIMALLHDVGRFEQLARHHTLSDHRSLDHAELGAKMVEERGLLDGLERRDLVLRVIAVHNRRSLPMDQDPATSFSSRLLRDADKLDIWHVVTAYYHGEADHPSSAMELGLPDTPGFSPPVVEELLARRLVDVRQVGSLNDLKLLQASWIYDVNFASTIAAVRKRGYLERIRAALPETAEVRAVFAEIETFVQVW